MSISETWRQTIARRHIAEALSQITEVPLRCGCLGLPTRPSQVTISEVQIGSTPASSGVTCNLNGAMLEVLVRDADSTEESTQRPFPSGAVEVDIGDLSDEEATSGERVKEKLLHRLGIILPRRFFRYYTFIHTWWSKCQSCQNDLRAVQVCSGEPKDSANFFWTFGSKLLDSIPTLRLVKGNYANVCPSCKAVQESASVEKELLDKENTSEITTELVTG